MPDEPHQLTSPFGDPATESRGRAASAAPTSRKLKPLAADPTAKTEQLLNTCPVCSEVIDVSEVRPYEKIVCPHCHESIRVRTFFDHFTLESEIGEGGMSRVFRAVDESLNRQVALKILHAEFFTNPEMTAQFEREARMTASINHPNVVKVYKVGSDQGYFYIAMELLDSRSLEDRIEKDGAMKEKLALRLLHEAALGLAAASQSGLLHRDIKPGNILLDSAGSAKIVDFGLALVHGQDDESGQLWATPFYVPPEKLTGFPEDTRSDIYSLGSAFFHALAGVPPYNARTDSIDELIAIKAQRMDLRDSAPRLRDSTITLINSMMAYDPNQRPQDYNGLIAMIDIVRKEVDPDYAGGHRHGPMFWVTMVGGVGVIIVALVLVFSFAFSGGNEPVVIGSGGNGNGGSGSGGSGGEFVVSAAQTAMINYLKEARGATQRGDLTAATESLEKLLATDFPNDELRSWAHFQLGVVALLEGRGDPARDHFSDCREIISSVRDAERATLDEVSGRLASSSPVSIGGLADAEDGGLGAFAMLLYALKNWTDGDYELCDRFINTYKTAEFPEDSWMAGVPSNGDQILADIKAFKGAPKFDPDATKEALETFRQKAGEIAAQIEVTPALAEKLQGQIAAAGKQIEELDKAAAAAMASKDQELIDAARAEADPLAEALNFRAAADVWEKLEVKGEAGRRQSKSLAEVMDSAAAFYDHFLSNLGSYRYEGEIIRREGRPFTAKIIRASPNDLVVDLGFGPTTLKLDAIAIEGLLQIAQKTVIRGTLTPELSEGAAFFSWLCDDATGAQALADTLSSHPGFDRRWSELTTSDFR